MLILLLSMLLISSVECEQFPFVVPQFKTWLKPWFEEKEASRTGRQISEEPFNFRLPQESKSVWDSIWTGTGTVPLHLPRLPDDKLFLTFSGNIQIRPNDTVTTGLLLSPPLLSWSTTPQSLYTVLLVNVDTAQTGLTLQLGRRTLFVHWLVVNTPGMSVKLGTPIFRYIPSITYSYNSSLGLDRSDTYRQRHLVLVYKQERRVDVNESTDSQCSKNIIKDRQAIWGHI